MNEERPVEPDGGGEDGQLGQSPQSPPILQTSPKEAAPEHIDHDHNLARASSPSISTSSGSADADPADTTRKQGESHFGDEVPSMPQEMYFEVELQYLLNQEQSFEQVSSFSTDPGPTTAIASSADVVNQDDDIIEIPIEENSDVTKAKKKPTKSSKDASSSVSVLNSTITGPIITIPLDGGRPAALQIKRLIYTNQLCRICLLSKEYLISAFENVKVAANGAVIENSRGPNINNRYNLLVALKALLDLEIKMDDGLPNQICIDCIDSLMSFSVFKKKIEGSQKRLTEVLAQVKNLPHSTIIPPLGELNTSATEVYCYSESILAAKKLLTSSSYSHMVSRRLPDKVWDKIFGAMVLMIGFKSAKLKELELYVMGSPFVEAWFCKTCQLTFHGSQDFFIQHCVATHEIENSSNVMFPCDICGKSYHKMAVPGSEEVYTEHWVQHFFPHECDICHKKLPSMKALWVHKRSAHILPQNLPSNQCETCGKKFRRRAHLLAHQKTHLNPEERGRVMNKCPICKKSLSGSIAAHIASIHSQTRPWKCDLCSKSFKRKETMVGHRSTVHGTAKFQCDACGMQLSSLAAKKSHELRHGGLKPHGCDKCDQSFFDKTALKAHQLTHKDVGDFCCNVCDKRFKREMYLKEHLRIHSDEKPYECPICQRRIRIRANYYKHLKVHKKNGTFDSDNSKKLGPKT